MNHARPQARQIRERKQGEGRPQSRVIRVREQSASTSSPRQQPRRQSVRSRDQGMVSTVRELAAATDLDTPRACHDAELAIATAGTLTGIGREPESATNCPNHHIDVVFSSLIHFPIHIRTISNYVRI